MLVSRGVDEGSSFDIDEVVTEIERLAARTSPVQIFTISFGDAVGDQILDRVATESLGGCSDATREGDKVDPCEKTAPDVLLDAIRGIV